MKHSINLPSVILVHLLIVAQLLFIFNDFPTYESLTKKTVQAKTTTLKFIVTESELLDGEDGKADFSPLDYLIEQSNALLVNFIIDSSIQKFFKTKSCFILKHIFLRNRSLLI